MDDYKRALRAWMEEVMARKAWTAEAWGRVSGTSATNITRFLKHGRFLPSSTTVSRLARAAGSTPPMIGGSPLIETSTIALYGSLADAQSGAARLGFVQSMVDVSDRAFALTVTSAALAMRGVFPGDVLVLEPVEVLTARDGDLVAYLGDGGEDVGQWAGGYVQRFDGRPPLAAADVLVTAVAVEVQRRLRAA